MLGTLSILSVMRFAVDYGGYLKAARVRQQTLRGLP
jgi:hypothetical protein